MTRKRQINADPAIDGIFDDAEKRHAPGVVIGMQGARRHTVRGAESR